jgi:hypothetical protein
MAMERGFADRAARTSPGGAHVCVRRNDSAGQVLAAVGVVAEADPRFDGGSREVSRPARCVLRMARELILAPKTPPASFVSAEKVRDRPEA